MINTKASSKNYQETFCSRIHSVGQRFLLLESTLLHAKDPYTFFVMLHYFLETVATQDPNAFHFSLSRTVFTHDEPSIDLLARKLLNTCHALHERLSLFSVKQVFTKEGLLVWDDAYLQLMATLGPLGKEYAELRREKLECNHMPWNFAFWFKIQDAEMQAVEGVKPFFQAPAFLDLTSILANDLH